MKNTLRTIFTILIFTVLFGKMLGWILHFNDTLNHILNTAMFTLIGIAYLTMGFVWNSRLLKIIIWMCGAFLIIMNFIESNTTLNIISIVCIVTPMLIARFYKEKVSEESII